MNEEQNNQNQNPNFYNLNMNPNVDSNVNTNVNSDMNPNMNTNLNNQINNTFQNTSQVQTGAQPQIQSQPQTVAGNSYTGNTDPEHNYSYQTQSGPFSNLNSDSLTGNNGYETPKPVYGTYQYATQNNTGVNTPNGGNIPPKKKNKAPAIIAVALVLVLFITGLGVAYFSHNGFSFGGSEAVADASTTASTENAAGTQAQKVSLTTTSSAVVTDITEMVEAVMPAMVMIHNNFMTSANYFGYSQSEEATASGSGIIVGQNDTELLVATNYHVIEGADSLEVIFCDDAVVPAVVKGTDSDMDLAVIAVNLEDISADTINTIKVATLGDSETLKLGEPAIAIGNALGYGQSVTTGVISALNREVEIEEGVTKTFIQTDAAINPGNSGGALLNINGEVIGINSNKLGGDVVEGMGYAIPISVAKPIIEELMNEETRYKVDESERGYVGIKGVMVTSDVNSYYGLPEGIYVAEVVPGGAAEAAGMKKGDVIVEFEGKEISSMEDLTTRLEYYAAGTTVTIKVMREGDDGYEEVELQVTLGSADDSATDSNGPGSGNGGQYPGQPNQGGNDEDDDG
ncbi:S1C family serine protease [Butyrivibrio proteoclasticus]|uniref:S1C family serine protease n=1 Tax=Butyrivibrio proteoclasticus TaxID=43305 RepID=UPI0006870CF0|nr:trypsin-like peptidase domain-containing protein [Butyrivibrio proteoclasticus]